MERRARLKGTHMDRCFQAILMISTASLSWLMMMVLHECGHVLHGWLSSARLVRVDLPLWSFSQTDFAANPHPALVAWGGGIWGCLLPLALWLIVRTTTPRYAFLAKWFAGFCLIANGAYMAAGSFFDHGTDDAGVILQYHGTSWQLLVFGIPAVVAGLYFWNGLGPHFGLGAGSGRVDRKAAVGMAIALLIVVCLEVMVSGN
jgi:hypothetical protein